jgi:hypothetical protein
VQDRAGVSESDENPGPLAKAHELEAEAARVGEETHSGLELRLEAAKLRAAALGKKSYPVLVCRECAGVTGWLSAGGSCDSCLRRAQVKAAYADPHGGFVVLDDGRPVHRASHPHHERPGSLARLLGGHAARERATADAWLSRVDPDTTGPIDAEDGFRIEVAHRDQVIAADGSGTLVRFRTATHRFDHGTWTELETTSIAHDGLLVPTEHSGGLPAEQLVDAWLDYKQAVWTVNRDHWANESEEREEARAAAEAREEAIREQLGAADLLDEDGP